MKQMQKFMNGRYGSDQLSFTLLLASLVLSILGSVFKIFLFALVANGLIIFSIYRTFSKNIYKRSSENYKFISFIAPMSAKVKNVQKKFKERKTHKYLKCPNCGQELRLPKNKGRIKITCPICDEIFEGRT